MIWCLTQISGFPKLDQLHGYTPYHSQGFLSLNSFPNRIQVVVMDPN